MRAIILPVGICYLWNRYDDRSAQRDDDGHGIDVDVNVDVVLVVAFQLGMGTVVERISSKKYFLLKKISSEIHTFNWILFPCLPLLDMESKKISWIKNVF